MNESHKSKQVASHSPQLKEFNLEKNKYKITEQNTLPLSGLVAKYGINKSDILFAILRPSNGSGYHRWLVGISLEKGILWEYKHPDFSPDELRIAANGDAYISSGNEIQQVDENGQLQKSITFELALDQTIGSFVLIEEGFLLAIEGNDQPNAKVLRTNLNGEIVWESPISPKGIAYKGVVQMRATNNWQVEEKPPWQPRSWNCLINNEIIVSGENVLVSYHEFPGSGVGMSFCLHIKTGAIQWTTKPAPFESVCGLKDGKFLIGHQGYGAFDMDLFDTDGKIIESWASAGKAVVNSHEQKFAIEMDNRSSSKLHFVALKKERKVKKGKRIPGYYIIYPVLDDLGNVVFWRDNTLMIIDKEGKLHTPFSLTPTDRDWTSNRMLLHQRGTLVFSVNDNLYVLKTNLGSLEQSAWACQCANNERNPVIKAKSNPT